MRYPLVRDLAADGYPVAVTCRVLTFSTQGYYTWLRRPLTDRDWSDAHLTNDAIDAHGDDPEFGYRLVADELRAVGHRVGDRRVWRLCSQQRLFSAHSRKQGSGKRPGPPNVLDRHRWDTRAQLRAAIVTWIERTYHHRRRQARLGRLTPVEFETIYRVASAA